LHPAGEFILAILDPVWPWEKQLPAADAAYLILWIPIDDVAIRDRVSPKTGAHFGDDRSLVARRQNELLPGWWAGRHRNRIIEGWHG